MRLVIRFAFAAMLVVVTTATASVAGTPNAVPEIDGVTLSAGLGLLAAGVLVIRSRRRKKS